MKYRAEIDGLRAIAILPVVLFHAGIRTFQGGFIGVDVFFVISGYLITTIILTDMNNNNFSIVSFYERRARRILPALFFMMLCCLPFAWMWLLPNHLKDFCDSLWSVTIFSSNFLFLKQSGYFAVTSELKPLLHTWSLAVEEQYYVLFPLFLMLLWKLRKRWIFSALVLVGGISLVAAQWGAFNKPSQTFFLLPTRWWELAIGALVAFYFVYKREQSELIRQYKKTSELLGFVGLLMICYSVFSFDNNTPFPSFYALLPTIGAGLVIVFATSETAVGKLLSSKVLVGIGLISYSTYLWHQPLFVFARHRSLEEPDTTLLLALSGASLLLAYISWRFIESPFRNKKLISRKAVFTFAVVGSVLFAGVGIAGHVNDGFGNRRNANGIALSEILQKVEINWGLNNECSKFTLSEKCRTSDDPEILLWGDSYAMHLAKGIIASKPDVKMIQMTKTVCGPFFNVAPFGNNLTTHWAEGCIDFNNNVHEWLKENKSVKYAVLASPFVQYINSELFINGSIEKASVEKAKEQMVLTLNEIESMGIRPVIFAPPPKNGDNIGDCLTKHEMFSEDISQCNFDRQDIKEKDNEVYRFLEMLPSKYKVVSLKDLICDNEICHANLDDTFIYRDTGHLSQEGSASLGKENNFYELITK